MDTTSHCTRHSRWKLQGRSAIGVLLVLLALSLLGWIYLTQASYVATTSRRVQKLEREKARLEQENLQLMTEIAELESVNRLAARAAELGFVAAPIEESEFLIVADMPPVQISETDSAPVARWWDSVAAQFTAWAQVQEP
jgi:cell division protein FtsB